jgi:hypothetical protein
MSMTRKQYNHALTAQARKEGLYEALMGAWCATIIAGYRLAEVSPAKALDYIIEGIAYKAPVVVEPKHVAVADIVEAPAREYTLAERLSLWAKAAAKRPTQTPADTAKVLKEAGFTREGTGCYSRAFFADGQSADAAYERAAFFAKRLEGAFLIHQIEDASVYAGTRID